VVKPCYAPLLTLPSLVLRMLKSLALVLCFIFLTAQYAGCQAQQNFTNKKPGSRQPATATAPVRQAKDTVKSSRITAKEAAAAQPPQAAWLEQQFHADQVWSGGDGAYSISLGSGKTLWLFGDSFLGTIAGGTRKDNLMIHNAVGLQDHKAGKISYYWSGKEKPSSFFSDGGGYWLWPGDGAFSNNRVYCFARRIGLVPGKENDPFGFVWKQDELVVIDNPADSPENWKPRHLALKFSDGDFHVGCACLAEPSAEADGWLYVQGIREKSRQAVLARISLLALKKLDLDSFEFLHVATDGKTSWTKQTEQASPIFEQAATEGSLLKTKDGYLCLYNRSGMGTEIVGRTAAQLTGPWSAEQLLYRIPESQSKRGFCYAGKAHPEQPAPPDYLAVTYAINPGDLAHHCRDPLAYFPHVIYLKTSSK
jgi:hypothetical protein